MEELTKRELNAIRGLKRAFNKAEGMGIQAFSHNSSGAFILIKKGRREYIVETIPHTMVDYGEGRQHEDEDGDLFYDIDETNKWT